MPSRPRAALPDDHDRAASSVEAAAGARAAFDELFRATYPGLYRFAYRLSRSPEAAEEIVQEVFFDLWRRRDLVDPSSVAHAYLYTSVRHAVISRVRRLRVEERTEERDDLGSGATHGSTGPSADEAVELADLSAAIDRAVECLPERCRLVYTLSRREHLSYAAIAAALGLSVKTVEAQMANAFRQIRTRVAPYLGSVIALLAAGSSRAG
jgi:RNA polymerase sigma-70 factor (ECF subfamily)